MSELIKCPECGKDMEKGVVNARDNSLLNTATTVSRSFFADSSIHTFLFLSLLLRFVSVP